MRQSLPLLPRRRGYQELLTIYCGSAVAANISAVIPVDRAFAATGSAVVVVGTAVGNKVFRVTLPQPPLLQLELLTLLVSIFNCLGIH